MGYLSANFREMDGLNYITDENGPRTAVVINLND